MSRSCWIPFPWKPLRLGTRRTGKLYFNILEDYPDIKNKKKKYELVREHDFFNALQVKFAYAVTCHKAQGGQWDTVFVDQGYYEGGDDRYRILPLAIYRCDTSNQAPLPCEL